MSWTRQDLINIEPARNNNFGQPYTEAVIARIVASANATRPKEITDFVEALTAMFGRIGMHGVCRLCFKGHLHSWLPAGRGCCGSCPHLTATQCANKPTGCAHFMCGTTSILFPKTYQFLNRVYQRIYKGSLGLDKWGPESLMMGCYPGSVEYESQVVLTDGVRRRLRWATTKVNLWNEVQP